MYDFDLEQHLWNKAKEYGFGKEKAEGWVKYMLDSSRGEAIYQNKLKAITASNARVLDLGCGYGAQLNSLSQHFKEVHGLDVEADRVKVSKLRTGLPIVQADAANTPYPNEYFDLITIVDVMEHVPRSAQLLIMKEVRRILKSDGKVYLTVPNLFQIHDDHNDGLIFAALLPSKLRKVYVTRFGSSQYCQTWNRTYLGWLNLFSHAGLNLCNLRFYLIINLIHSNFEFILGKI